MSAQPLLFHRERDPAAAPMKFRFAIGVSDLDPIQVKPGTRQDDPAWWDREYPACAPHRIADFAEVIP